MIETLVNRPSDHFKTTEKNHHKKIGKKCRKTLKPEFNCCEAQFHDLNDGIFPFV